MNTFAFRLVILMILTALAATGCGGANTPPTPTRDSSIPATGDPAEMVAEFYEALFSGGDPAAFVCAASPEVAAVFRQASAMASMGLATVDISGLNIVVTEQTAESATVTVSGNLIYRSPAGETTEEYPETSVYVVNEGGTWKVCGSE
jgi:hypothetical protein